MVLKIRETVIGKEIEKSNEPRDLSEIAPLLDNLISL